MRSSGKRLLYLALMMSVSVEITSCGAAHFSQGCSSAGFVNQTNATDAQLESLWQGAQQQLATQPIPLNPVISPKKISYAPPDKRALNIQPACQVKVVSEPNVLLPPGGPGFACSASPTGYCGGMTLGSDPWTIEVVEPDLLEPGATGWEFQNVILEKLGYNVSGR